jgi:hypothetical protein
MSRKIRYSGGRRIGGEVEEGKKTRRCRRRKVGDILTKGKRRKRERDNVKAFLKRAFFTFVGCLL